MLPGFHKSLALLFVLLLLLVMTVGCGPRNPHAITVTLDGQPVESGYLFVSPDLAKGNDGAEAIFKVTNGAAANVESSISKPGPMKSRLLVRGDPTGQSGSPDDTVPNDPKTYTGAFELPESGETTLDFKSSSLARDDPRRRK